MDIALQNFDVHAFRAAFQMVNVPLFKTNLSFQSFHLYSGCFTVCFMFGHSSFILMFNMILKYGLEHVILSDEYAFLFT